MKHTAIKIMSLAIVIIFLSSFQIIHKWKAPIGANKLVNPLKNNTKATIKGQKIYEKMCWSCHGISGKGDGPLAKSLNPKPSNHTSKEVQIQSDGAIYWKISTGKEVMPAYLKILSKTERWELVNYIRKLETK